MNPSGTKEPTLIPPAREARGSTSEAAASAGAKLRNAAIVAGVLIIIGTVAGLVPRSLHRNALRAETRELAAQIVSVVSPVPGKTAAGLTLPAEAKRSSKRRFMPAPAVTSNAIWWTLARRSRRGICWPRLTRRS